MPFEHGTLIGRIFVRVNPDVIIRDDAWLLQTMHNSDVDGIFTDCDRNWTVVDGKKCSVAEGAGRRCLDSQIQSDFFGFRPSAIGNNSFQKWSYSFLGGLDKHIITGLEVNSNQDPECEGVPVFKFAGKQVCATLG